MGLALIFALAVALAFVPALVHRWAVPRGASPETLALLAALTLVGIVAVPVAFTLCTGTLALQDVNRGVLSLASATGLLLVALAAGRSLARVLQIRRCWAALSRVAAALELPEEATGVKVLPVGELLAFVSGTEAFISQGLIDRLTPAQRGAVLAHEREHAERGHARLSSLARAVTHGAFGLGPARDASIALNRELDALADRAAARSSGPAAVGGALRAVATATSGRRRLDPATRARIERLRAPETGRRSRVDVVVRLVSLAFFALLLASICLSIHATSVWLGVAACVLLVVGFTSFSRPLLRSRGATSSSPRSQQSPDG